MKWACDLAEGAQIFVDVVMKTFIVYVRAGILGYIYEMQSSRLIRVVAF